MHGSHPSMLSTRQRCLLRMTRQNVGDVNGRYAERRRRSLFRLTILPLLVLCIQLMPDFRGHVIVGLQDSILGVILDEASHVWRSHPVMLLPVWLNPAVRTPIARRTRTAHKGVHLLPN